MAPPFRASLAMNFVSVIFRVGARAAVLSKKRAPPSPLYRPSSQARLPDHSPAARKTVEGRGRWSLLMVRGQQASKLDHLLRLGSAARVLSKLQDVTEIVHARAPT